MINNKYLILLIYILNLLSNILCQLENESVSKALACMAALNQKLRGEEPDPSIYSTMMLKCFMTMTDSQSKKILLGIEKGQGEISQKELDKLTDYESLQDYSQNEIKQKSIELEKALKTFKKMQEQITGEESDMNYDDLYGDETYQGDTPSKINFFSVLPRGIMGIFNVFGNYLSLFFVLAIVYFGLLMIRKINDSERKMEKKKRMMKKKYEEEYEEEEEEEYEHQINYKKKK